MPQLNKTRGQAKRTSLALFGRKGMESREERMMVAATLLHSASQQMRLFALALTDLANQRTSLGRLAERHGLPYVKIAEEYQSLKRAEGLIRQSRHLPDLMEQVAEDAKSEHVQCPICDGARKTQRESGDMVLCDTCRGKGTIRVGGDIKLLELVFKSAKLIGEPQRGPLVNVNVGDVPKDEKLEDLYQTLGPIVEGGIVDDDSAGTKAD